MTPLDVRLKKIGKPEWPRWMIVHGGRRRYWNKGKWRKRRREGELWQKQTEAEQELFHAQVNWRCCGPDDE